MAILKLRKKIISIEKNSATRNSINETKKIEDRARSGKKNCEISARKVQSLYLRSTDMRAGLLSRKLSDNSCKPKANASDIPC